MKIGKVGLMLALVIALLSCTGCGVSEDRHIAELEQQARRYEQQLKDQRQQYEDEKRGKQVWFVILLIANNAGWFFAYRKKA